MRVQLRRHGRVCKHKNWNSNTKIENDRNYLIANNRYRFNPGITTFPVNGEKAALIDALRIALSNFMSNYKPTNSSERKFP